MSQMKEDEWPEDGEETTTEHEHLKEDPEAEQRGHGTESNYPPALPPSATPPLD